MKKVANAFKKPSQTNKGVDGLYYPIMEMAFYSEIERLCLGRIRLFNTGQAENRGLCPHRGISLFICVSVMCSLPRLGFSWLQIPS